MNKKKTINIYSDGGSRGNPGPASCAFIGFENGKVVVKKSLFLGTKTNNYAEYMGIYLAFDWLIKNIKSNTIQKIIINLDSELATNQLKGKYKVKSNNLKSLITKIKKIENNLGIKVVYKYIPRNKNKLADHLVNKTLDEKLK